MDQNHIGPQGEKLAAHFLRKAGLKILATNVRYPTGELDIAALEGDTLVLVEVKTRQDAGALNVPDVVGPAKRQRWWAAARRFIREEAPPHDAVRLDVVCVFLPAQGTPVIEHHPGAFGPGKG